MAGYVDRVAPFDDPEDWRDGEYAALPDYVKAARKKRKVARQRVIPEISENDA